VIRRCGYGRRLSTLKSPEQNPHGSKVLKGRLTDLIRTTVGRLCRRVPWVGLRAESIGRLAITTVAR
jgi:hypothetical protein